jgi:hypothetical protein
MQRYDFFLNYATIYQIIFGQKAVFIQSLTFESVYHLSNDNTKAPRRGDDGEPCGDRCSYDAFLFCRFGLRFAAWLLVEPPFERLPPPSPLPADPLLIAM